MITKRIMDQAEIQLWLINKISSLANIKAKEISIKAPLAEYDLDSVHAVGLSGDIEDWLGITVEPTIAWDYPTIEQMAGFLSMELKVVEPSHSLQKVA